MRNDKVCGFLLGKYTRAELKKQCSKQATMCLFDGYYIHRLQPDPENTTRFNVAPLEVRTSAHVRQLRRVSSTLAISGGRQ